MTTLQISVCPIETEQGRMYDTPIGRLPSVNTILDATEPQADRERLQQWRQKQVEQLGEAAAEQSAIAARDRGTAIHALIAEFLTSRKQPPESEIDPALLLYWKSIRCWLRLVGPSATVSHEVYGGSRAAIEMPVFHPQLCYAGTLDWIGQWEPGEWWLVDFKTSSSPKFLSWLKRYRLQLAAYRLAADAMLGRSIAKAVIPISLASGQPAQIFELTPEQLAEDEAEWLDRLRQFKEGNP